MNESNLAAFMRYENIEIRVPGWSKRPQMRGARQTDERRRTQAVRWSEAMERNEAGEPFSTAW